MEIARKYIDKGHSISLVLRVLEVERSTYYAHVKETAQNPIQRVGRPAPGYSYTTTGTRVSDEEICEWLMEFLAGEGASFGYRKLTVLLKRRHQLVINKKKIYRLCTQLNVLRPQRELKLKHPRRLANNRVITGSNQLWETDIKYGWMAGERRFFFIMCILDVFDRAIISYHLGLTCEARHLVQITQEALMKRQLFDKPKEEKPFIRSDNGPQFISHRFEEACETFGITHERIPPRTPNKNAHIESFHSILEAECYQRHEFESYPETYEIVTQFIQDYNQQRIHGSIYDLSPYEYIDALQKNLVKPKEIKV
ncbi:IS3 family transposase [Paenibacillus sp. 19GGS1-52]|nr:IS3 family transposase [Paenibacillus sp. 19GGS1-52]ULO10231.1 IS3 family transposase [Paenibacillus sp. 19GGS1-52]ULO10361.1 IS3 family transposase [Paenibacillus sp. 19GGS1-52]